MVGLFVDSSGSLPLVLYRRFFPFLVRLSWFLFLFFSSLMCAAWCLYVASSCVFKTRFVSFFFFLSLLRISSLLSFGGDVNSQGGGIAIMEPVAGKMSLTHGWSKGHNGVRPTSPRILTGRKFSRVLRNCFAEVITACPSPAKPCQALPSCLQLLPFSRTACERERSLGRPPLAKRVISLIPLSRFFSLSLSSRRLFYLLLFTLSFLSFSLSNVPCSLIPLFSVRRTIYIRCCQILS